MRRQMWMPEIVVWGKGLVPAHFALAAHIEGEISGNQLQEAAKRLAQRHPLLTAHTVAKDDYTYWFDTDTPEPIEIKIVPRVDASTWLGATADTVNPTFNLDKGPLARITLVQGTDRSEIILALHHCLADGISASYALHDLLVFLSDPTADLPVLMMSRWPIQLVPRWIRTLAGMMPLRLAFPGLHQKGTQLSISDFTNKTGNFHIMAWTLDQEQTQAIVTRGRSEGVSVHSIISTAFLRAWAEVVGGDSHTVSTPISLRDYLTEPVGNAIAMLIWAYNKVTLPNTPDVPFWDQARTFQHDLKRQISPFKLMFPIAVAQRVLDKYPLEQLIASIDVDSEIGGHTLSITNLGRLKLNQEYGVLRLVDFYGPILDANAQEVVMGVATTNGSMAFALTFRDTVLTPDTAQKIREAAAAQIYSALQ